MKFAVLISGRGTNLQALIDVCRDKTCPGKIVLVVSNKAGVQGLERAHAADIATRTLDHKAFETREAFDAAMSTAIKDAGAQFVCLAGFMRVLSNDFVRTWRDKLINIHPSLLPAYKGLHVHERMIEDGARFAGCTVHFIRPALDEGPIIAQAVVPVHPGDTADDLAQRILKQEHIVYPLVLKLIAQGRVRISAERVLIDDHHPPEGTLVNPVADPDLNFVPPTRKTLK